jgi:hypothetical protein
MLFGAQAFGADPISHDSMGMKKDSMGKHDKMMKDCMSKMQSDNTTNMTHDQMMQMCKDKMKSGSMGKDSMSKDSMKKKE